MNQIPQNPQTNKQPLKQSYQVRKDSFNVVQNVHNQNPNKQINMSRTYSQNIPSNYRQAKTPTLRRINNDVYSPNFFHNNEKVQNQYQRIPVQNPNSHLEQGYFTQSNHIPILQNQNDKTYMNQKSYQSIVHNVQSNNNTFYKNKKNKNFSFYNCQIFKNKKNNQISKQNEQAIQALQNVLSQLQQLTNSSLNKDDIQSKEDNVQKLQERIQKQLQQISKVISNEKINNGNSLTQSRSIENSNLDQNDHYKIIMKQQEDSSIQNIKNLSQIKNYIKVNKINFHSIQDDVQEQTYNLLVRNLLSQNDILGNIRRGIQGRYNLIQTPWGHKLRIYADFTASGQDIKLIDEIMQSIKECYSNTHTEASHDGKIMNQLFHNSQKQILKSCNVTSATHSVISVGSGCTGAIELIQKILGTYVAPKMIENLNTIISFQDIKTQLRDKGILPLVLVTSYEHHSNEITWRNQLCDVQVVPLCSQGFMDYNELESILQTNQNKYKNIICSFSAGSNVTGIKTDVNEVIKRVKKFTAYLFLDYAGVGPYVKIDLSQNIDGIYISPHKFLGGPGTCGLAIFKNSIYPSHLNPTHGGGGTVDFVNEKLVYYQKDIMNREQSGTPGILQTIKAGLAFMIKDMLYPSIHKTEKNMLIQFFERFKNNSKVYILGPLDYLNRVSIVSFTIKHKERLLHSNYIVKLLSDLFGIQARSGCSCAGPYGHKLLNINETISLELLKWIRDDDQSELNFEGVKFGWARINLHYSLEFNDLEYIMSAIEFIANHGYKFLKYYLFQPHSGSWSHLNEVKMDNMTNLSPELLLTNKFYAKNEEDRRQLLQCHLKEADELMKNIGEFDLENFDDLGNVAYFYAAKGNVQFMDNIQQKCQNCKVK